METSLRVRQNGQLLDRGFLAGSLAVIAIWLAYPFGFAHAHQFSELIESNSVWAIGYAAVAVLFCCRRDSEERQASQASTVEGVSGPLFVIGIGLLVVWFVLFRFEMLSNLENILADPIPLLAGIVAIPVISFILVRYYTRGGRKAIV